MFFFGRGRNHRIKHKETMERVKDEEPLPLEKRDLPAIFIAAFVVFMPFLVGFAALTFLLFWLLVGRF